MKTAFLGLGTMGEPMAHNILRKGHSLTVWNRTADRAARLVAAGAQLAASPRQAAQHAEIVISMLADVPAVESVLTGPQGAVNGITPGTVVVDMSTVDPATAKRMSAATEGRGGRFIDAPVSGSRKPAEDGTLLIMAGGAPEAIEAARPVLESMGKLMVVGGVGQGMAMKLVLNGLGAHLIAGFSSMLVMGAKLGLRPREMLQVIQAGAFSSPLFAMKGQRIMHGEFAPDFSLALLRKDQLLVNDIAAHAGLQVASHEGILRMLEEAIAQGLGQLDMCALIRLFERSAGVEVRDRE